MVSPRHLDKVVIIIHLHSRFCFKLSISTENILFFSASRAVGARNLNQREKDMENQMHVMGERNVSDEDIGFVSNTNAREFVKMLHQQTAVKGTKRQIGAIAKGQNKKAKTSGKDIIYYHLVDCHKSFKFTYMQGLPTHKSFILRVLLSSSFLFFLLSFSSSSSS